MVVAFLQAGLYSACAITLILAVTLRHTRDVVLTMLPVLLSGLLTFATCAVLDLPLNFANIIALPLLFGASVMSMLGFWTFGIVSVAASLALPVLVLAVRPIHKP